MPPAQRRHGGETYRVLVEERNEKSGLLSGRTASSVVIDFPGGEELIGQYAQVKVTAARSWMLRGSWRSDAGGIFMKKLERFFADFGGNSHRPVLGKLLYLLWHTRRIRSFTPCSRLPGMRHFWFQGREWCWRF